VNNPLLINVLFFILGCLFGSFLSVVIYRLLHRQKGIFFGHSRCPKCKHKLMAWDLIPIVSWLYKGGRCSYCHQPISPVYPSLELVCGLLFLTNYNMVAAGQHFLFFNNYQIDWLFAAKIFFLCLVTLNLVAIFFSDLQKKVIPEVLLYSWILLCLFSSLLTGVDLLAAVTDRTIALAVALLFFGGQNLLSKGKWLGSGDIYVAAGMALLLGLNNFLLAVACSYILGCVLALLLLVSKKVKFSDPVPFAPFLLLGTLIALYHGNDFLIWYLGSLLLIK